MITLFADLCVLLSEKPHFQIYLLVSHQPQLSQSQSALHGQFTLQCVLCGLLRTNIFNSKV